MRSLLQFLAVWGAVIGFNGGAVIVALWALSMDGDPRDERAASSLLSSLLWSTFWPLMWPFRGREGKETDRGRRRFIRSEAGIRRFRTAREAKEYLVGVIANEAEHDGAPLTEVERKMLFFTETGWTLPEMKQVSAEFDRSYVQDEYEAKIASIAAKVRARFTDERQQEQMTWDSALEKLNRGDHYLLILIDGAIPARSGASKYLRMLLSVLVLFALGWLDLWFRRWLRAH
ncbi:MAG TPA: hypothetical protein VIY53_12560 [Acidobacteriaceae bacterium]